MDVFGQIRHLTPIFIADTRWNSSKYASQLRHNGIKHILNMF
jgi:hypothetical protein